MSGTLSRNKIIAAVAVLLVVLSVVGYVLYLTDTVEVTFINGDGTVSKGRTLVGFTPTFMPEPAEKPRLTFVGWETEEGTLIWPDAVKPRTDLTVTAKYMVSWDTDTHNAYLPMDSSGFAQPDANLTRGEAAQMLYNLYEMPLKCTGHYAGKHENPDYFKAVGVLFTLGMYERHNRYESDRAITRGELMELLTAFHPAKRYTVFFSDLSPNDAYYDAFVRAASLGWIEWGYDVPADPNGLISRGEAAALMNHILGRQPADNVSVRSVGVFPDMKPDHPYYGDLVEALIVHKYLLKDGVETRRNWQPPERPEAGRVFVDNWHYCIGEDGYLVSDTEVDGFLYDENGRFTTGMPELDALLLEVTDEILTPDMDREQRKRTAFDYTVDAFTYLRIEKYKRRTNDWGEIAAYKMLDTKYGNCYSYAAVYYELCRVLGEDPILISGAVGIYGAPHGWVEFMDGKTRYVCDPELEMAITKRGSKPPNLYMISGWKLNNRMYYR